MRCRQFVKLLLAGKFLFVTVLCEVLCHVIFRSSNFRVRVWAGGGSGRAGLTGEEGCLAQD